MVRVMTKWTAHEEAGRSSTEEVTTVQKTFDLTMWIRARRLQWLGHTAHWYGKVCNESNFRYDVSSSSENRHQRTANDTTAEGNRRAQWDNNSQSINTQMIFVCCVVCRSWMSVFAVPVFPRFDFAPHSHSKNNDLPIFMKYFTR